MPLKLIYSPANTGKTGLVYKAWNNSLEKGENPILVLPTQADALRTKKELAQKTGCIIGGLIINFDDLFRKIILSCQKEPNAVSYIQRKILLQTAINNTDLRLLKESSKYRGFANAVYKTIDDLITSGILPEEFIDSLKKMNKKPDFAGEAALIYEKYIGYLNKFNFVEPGQVGFMAASILEKTKNIGSSKIFFHKFDDFSTSQKLFIEKCSKITDVIVTFTFEEDRDVFSCAKNTFRWLKSLSGKNIEALKPSSGKKNYSDDTLFMLERKLFSNEINAINLQKNGDLPVVLLESAGGHNEIELVAAEISRLVKGHDGNGKYKPNEIAVIIRDATKYRAEIQRIFKAYNLPFSCRFSYKIRETAFGRATLSVAENLRSLISYADKMAKNCFSSDRPFSKENDAGALDFKAYTLISKALTEAIELLENKKGTANLLFDLKLLHDWLYDMEIETLQKPEEDYIQILSPSTARGRRFKVVFILGLNEGVYPKRKTGDPFIPNKERANLKSAGLKNINIPAEDIDDEKLLFYLLMTRAKERIYLSYRCSDEKGGEKLMSFFLDELLQLFNEKAKNKILANMQRKGLEDIVFDSMENCPSLVELKRHIALNGYMNFKNLPADIETELKQAKNKSYPAIKNLRISKDLINSVFRKDKEMSASSIKKYIDCPYIWFSVNVLKLKPFYEPFGVKDAGSIFHDVACRLYKNMLNGKTHHSVDELLEEAINILEEIIQTKFKKLTAAQELILKNEIRHLIKNLLLEDLSYNGSFSPKADYLEIKFGESRDANFPALQVAGRKICGTIDRIDIDGTNKKAVIYDYKTGTNCKTLNTLIKEKDIQALLYAKAFENASGKDLKVAGALYRYPKLTKASGFTFEAGSNAIGLSTKEQDIESSVKFYEQLESILKNVFRSIENGVIDITDKCPNHCSFSMVCRKEAH